jgi:uncharacterized membrane protein YgcG
MIKFIFVLFGILTLFATVFTYALEDIYTKNNVNIVNVQPPITYSSSSSTRSNSVRFGSSGNYSSGSSSFGRSSGGK